MLNALLVLEILVCGWDTMVLPNPIGNLMFRGGHDKNTNNIFCPLGFYHLGSLGIYFDKIWIQSKKKK